MKIFAWFLLIGWSVDALNYIGKKDADKAGNRIGALLMALPLIGRVLEWW